MSLLRSLPRPEHQKNSQDSGGLRILRPVSAIQMHVNPIILGHGTVCIDFNLALVGKLDSVGEQVQEDLAQPVRVANYVRICRRAQETADLKPLTKGLACDRVHRLFHNLRHSSIILQSVQCRKIHIIVPRL